MPLRIDVAVCYSDVQFFSYRTKGDISASVHHLQFATGSIHLSVHLCVEPGSSSGVEIVVLWQRVHATQEAQSVLYWQGRKYFNRNKDVKFRDVFSKSSVFKGKSISLTVYSALQVGCLGEIDYRSTAGDVTV